MKIHSRRSPNSQIKPRPLLRLVAALLLIVLGVGLLVMHSQGNAVAKQFRAAIQIKLAPVVDWLSAPADYLDAGINAVRDIAALYEQNQRLKDENAQLLKWQTAARQLKKENAELRRLLGVRLETNARYVTASVSSRVHDPLSHTMLVRHRYDEAVKPGMTVMAPEGLVGHVLETTGQFSQVLLLTDRQSRLPVLNEQTGQRGILVGTNQEQRLELRHIETPEQFSVGDRIVTGENNIFLERLVVGEVSEIEEGRVYVTPYVDVAGLQFVRIVLPKTEPAESHRELLKLPELSDKGDRP